MPIVRLVADDLTGALDSVAPFAAAFDPIEVLWARPEKLAGLGSLALDTETRDIPSAAALARAREWAPFFRGADLAYKKIDSVLRGPVTAEIAGVWAAGLFRSAVIAPAFPNQGRVTRGGRQHVRELDGGWRALPVDLVGELCAAGVNVQLAANAGQLAESGAWLCDAGSEGDLAAIVEAGRRLAPPVLWVGAAGLARALAGYPPRRAPEAWDLPWLGFIGTRHELTRRQIERLEETFPGSVVPMSDLEDSTAQKLLQRVARDLGRGEGRLLHLRLPPGQPRSAVLAALDRFANLVVANLPRPGTLLACGGETLMRLCSVEQARSLAVTGEYAPGIPLAELMHGVWSGARVVAKSGGFGDENFLVDIVRAIEGHRS